MGNKWQDRQSIALDIYAQAVRHNSGMAQKAFDYFILAYQAWLREGAGLSPEAKRRKAYFASLGIADPQALKPSKDPTEEETIRACKARLMRAIAKQCYPDTCTELLELAILTGEAKYYQLLHNLTQKVETE